MKSVTPRIKIVISLLFSLPEHSPVSQKRYRQNTTVHTDTKTDWGGGTLPITLMCYFLLKIVPCTTQNVLFVQASLLYYLCRGINWTLMQGLPWFHVNNYIMFTRNERWLFEISRWGCVDNTVMMFNFCIRSTEHTEFCYWRLVSWSGNIYVTSVALWISNFQKWKFLDAENICLLNSVNKMLPFYFTAGCNEKVYLMSILPLRAYWREKEKISYVLCIPTVYTLPWLRVPTVHFVLFWFLIGSVRKGST
jgi:hypothetical protein